MYNAMYNVDEIKCRAKLEQGQIKRQQQMPNEEKNKEKTQQRGSREDNVTQY